MSNPFKEFTFFPDPAEQEGLRTSDQLIGAISRQPEMSARFFHESWRRGEEKSFYGALTSSAIRPHLEDVAPSFVGDLVNVALLGWKYEHTSEEVGECIQKGLDVYARALLEVDDLTSPRDPQSEDLFQVLNEGFILSLASRFGNVVLIRD